MRTSERVRKNEKPKLSLMYREDICFSYRSSHVGNGCVHAERATRNKRNESKQKSLVNKGTHRASSETHWQTFPNIFSPDYYTEIYTIYNRNAFIDFDYLLPFSEINMQSASSPC